VSQGGIMHWADQYNAMRGMLFSSPATHRWVCEVIVLLEQKDPVDVLNGLEIVARLMRMRQEAILAGEWDQLNLQKSIEVPRERIA